MPYNIYLSMDPFIDHIQIHVDIFGTHSTMGFIFEHCSTRNKPQLVNIINSQPASCIKKWRTTLWSSYIMQIEEYPIDSIQNIINAIAECCKCHSILFNSNLHLTWTQWASTNQRYPTHLCRLVEYHSSTFIKCPSRSSPSWHGLSTTLSLSPGQGR